MRPFENLTNVPNHKVTELPKEVALLANLKVLNAGYNELTSLPDEIGQLANLQELHLHFNGDPPRQHTAFCSLLARSSGGDHDKIL